MKFFSKFYLAAAAAVVLAGCASDLPDGSTGNGDNGKDGPGVYIGVNIKPSSATRGFTDDENSSSNGTEEGSDIENNVNELIIVLARSDDNGFIAATTVTKENLKIGKVNGQDVYNAVAKVESSFLDDYYQDTNYSAGSNGNRTVNVFVFCNPTGALVGENDNDVVDLATYLDGAKYGDTEWINLGCKVTVKGQVTNGSIWSSTMGGQFLMSNRDLAPREIPGTAEGWNAYTNSDKPFNLSAINGTPGAVGTIDNGTGRGPVLVERAAARIDFRDGAEDPENDPAAYHVVYMRNKDGSNNEEMPVIDVVLQKMSLVNMSNQFYYVRRVSPTGLNQDVEICGAELPWFTDANGTWAGKPGNWVVDYDAGKYELPLTKNFSQYFNYPFFNEDGTVDNLYADGLQDRWGTVNIADILAKDQVDKWENPKQGNEAGTYKVWRYMTENTSWDPVSNQMNGNTTGIVFKGHMRANDALLDDANVSDDVKALIKTINNIDIDGKGGKLGNTDTDPIIYTFAGSIYLTWEKVVEAAINASFSYTQGVGNAIIPDWNRTNTLYQAVFGNGGTGHKVYADDGKTVIYEDTMKPDEESANAKWNAWNLAGRPTQGTPTNKAFKEAATNANFTIYQSSQDLDHKWGYYCYYYYWNHHNDNGNDGVMAPMEMAVVRNNVYKIAVTKLKRLGHPRLSENDPEPPHPDTPDESQQVYLTVDTQVVPWVVRVKEIVFD